MISFLVVSAALNKYCTTVRICAIPFSEDEGQGQWLAVDTTGRYKIWSR